MKLKQILTAALTLTLLVSLGGMAWQTYQLKQAEEDFNDSGDDWLTKLKYQPRTGQLENSVYNLNLILNNDPDFQHFAFNELANRIEITGPLPWERPKGNKF